MSSSSGVSTISSKFRFIRVRPLSRRVYHGVAADATKTGTRIAPRPVFLSCWLAIDATPPAWYDGLSGRPGYTKGGWYMIAFIGVAATLGVFGCLVLAVVSRLRGGNAKIPLLWAAVCVALVAFMASFETDKPAEATEPPPDAPEAVEAQEPADSAEPAQNDTETPPESVTEPVTTEEPEPEPAPVEETPQPEETLSVEECVALVRESSQRSYGADNCNVHLKEGGRVLIIDIWYDGLATDAALARNGDPEALAGWNESVVATSLAVAEAAQDVLNANGHQDVTVLFNVLNDQNRNNALLVIMFGAVMVDAANGINNLN